MYTKLICSIYTGSVTQHATYPTRKFHLSSLCPRHMKYKYIDTYQSTNTNCSSNMYIIVQSCNE